MLPMIAVAGSHSTMRRYNKLWDRARASTDWWQNPTLSFGPGYPQWVPANSALVDMPPIQANPMLRARTLPKPVSGGIGHAGVCRELCKHHGVGIAFHTCYQDCMGPTLSKPGAGTLTARRRTPRRTTLTGRRLTPRGNCYSTSASACKPGFANYGYDKDGNLICCSGRAGPLVLNPSGSESAKPSLVRRILRMTSSKKRRRRARAIARAARSMVTVGKKACCESCAHGGPCKGGCGDNCNCGKQGRHKNPHLDFSPTPTMRMMPARVQNARTVQVGDMVFATPTTSRLANVHRRRRARLTRAGSMFITAPTVRPRMLCNKNADCGKFMDCVKGRCVERPR